MAEILKPPKPRAARGWLRFGWALWILSWLTIGVMVVSRPSHRTVTHLYHDAVERWEGRESIYDGPQGMNYLPAFVPLFAPYHALPLRAGDVLWRTTAFAAFCFGFWWFTRRSTGESDDRMFALVTLLGLPLCLGALRNGQANAHLGAVLLLAAVCLTTRRWGAASALLALSVAIKPLGLAAVGLAFATYPGLWWRLLIGLLAALAFPFAFGPAGYVQDQYLAAYANLRECSTITENRFADINGLLRALGMPVQGMASILLRAGAGIAGAAFCFFQVRNLRDRERALGWLIFSAGYLMLFNPMNEKNSYAILGPAFALWVWHLFAKVGRPLGWLLVGAPISMSLLPNLLRPWLGNAFALFWHPAITLLFLGLLAARIAQERKTPPSPQVP